MENSIEREEFQKSSTENSILETIIEPKSTVHLSCPFLETTILKVLLSLCNLAKLCKWSLNCLKW